MIVWRYLIFNIVISNFFSANDDWNVFASGFDTSKFSSQRVTFRTAWCKCLNILIKGLLKVLWAFKDKIFLRLSYGSLQMKFTSFILKRTFVQGYVIFSILNFQTFQEDFDRCKTLIRMFNAVPDHL